MSTPEQNNYCDSCGGVGTVGQGSTCPVCNGTGRKVSSEQEQRDATMRELAFKFSELANGKPLDLTVGGVVLFIVAQCDHIGDKALDKYTAEKLRSVADFLDPKT